jgi:hypothetical protein
LVYHHPGVDLNGLRVINVSTMGLLPMGNNHPRLIF